MNFPPAISSDQAIIHILRAPGRGGAEDRVLLSLEEQVRAARFRFETDRLRWIGWRAETRRILGRCLELRPECVPMVVTSTGKPRLAMPYEGLHFNLSHATDFAALVVTRNGPVGVDIEAADRGFSLLECAEAFCHPKELAMLPVNPSARARVLLRLWTAKEALLKAVGSGFFHPPHNLLVHGDGANSESFLPGLEDLRLHFPKPPPGHLLAVALPLGAREPLVRTQKPAGSKRLEFAR